MRKPGFCICENKAADQLRGYREADQRLSFRFIASTIHLLPKYKISSLYPPSVTAQPGLCRTRSDIPKTGFLTTRLNYTFSSLVNLSLSPGGLPLFAGYSQSMSTPSKFLFLRNFTVLVANSRRLVGVATILVKGSDPMFQPPTAINVFMAGFFAFMSLNREYLV